MSTINLIHCYKLYVVMSQYRSTAYHRRNFYSLQNLTRLVYSSITEVSNYPSTHSLFGKTEKKLYPNLKFGDLLPLWFTY